MIVVSYCITYFANLSSVVLSTFSAFPDLGTLPLAEDFPILSRRIRAWDSNANNNECKEVVWSGNCPKSEIRQGWATVIEKNWISNHILVTYIFRIEMIITFTRDMSPNQNFKKPNFHKNINCNISFQNHLWQWFLIRGNLPF